MYRKFSAPHIFTGHQLLGSGHVLITDTAGRIIEITTATEAGDDIQHFNGVLTPGFINAHCHLELSHMKGFIPEKTGLVDFVCKVVSERHFNEDEILSAIEAGENEMLQNGIVAVGDICNSAATIAQKSRERLRYHNFIEATGFPPAVAAARFNRSLGFYKQYMERFEAVSLVPHAPYSVSPELFKMIDEFPNNRIITIHNQETAEENEFFQTGSGDFVRLYENMNIDISFFRPSGKSSLQTYLPLLNNYQSFILVHNVHTTAEDIQFEKNHSATISDHALVYYCLCPRANQYISGTVPDANLLIQQQCNVVLGTDSLASNHQLSILEEMKTLQQHYPTLSLQTLLPWATINGAKALQLDSELGSFEKNKKPGIVLIENEGSDLLTPQSFVKKIL